MWVSYLKKNTIKKKNRVKSSLAEINHFSLYISPYVLLLHKIIFTQAIENLLQWDKLNMCIFQLEG